MPELIESLTRLEADTARLPRDSAAFAGLTEAELLLVPTLYARILRNIEPSAAGAAGEIARRSTREQGFDGLAQRTGFRTPEGLLQNLTGSSSREASKLVRTGVIIREAEIVTEAERTGEVPPELTKPWLAAVGRAVAAGTLSIEASESIRVGLGIPSDDISADALADAAAQLVEEASALNPDAPNADELLIRARALRDELDEAGIADREKALRNARSFRRFRRPDGMTAYSMLADPENAAYIDGIYDSLTSPRRGGPRMVDLADKSRAEAIATDPRTTEQFSFDGFMAILRIGATTDEKTAARNVLGSRRPSVRVLVTRKTLTAGGKPSLDSGESGDNGEGRDGANNGKRGDGGGIRDGEAGGGSRISGEAGGGSRISGEAGSKQPGRRGHGRIEGQPIPVSLETVERTICEAGTVEVGFDETGQCIDLGREQRLFSTPQRIALAARDGGCRWPCCDRPASWSEAHHINQWKRDNGKTDVADGILLCRYHHLLLHDNHWDITRTGGDYWLHPPASEDPTRTPRPMPHKSAALRDLEREDDGQEEPHRLTG